MKNSNIIVEQAEAKLADFCGTKARYSSNKNPAKKAGSICAIK